MNEILCSKIREAFAGVKLGKGIGLHEADGQDDYEDAATCASYRASDEKDDWSRIPVEKLNKCFSSLSYFDPESMRFHLPAFLISDLQGTYNFDLSLCLTNPTDYDTGQFDLFSDTQRSAVRDYLLHIAEDVNHQFDRPQIIRALDEYWTDPTSV